MCLLCTPFSRCLSFSATCFAVYVQVFLEYIRSPFTSATGGPSPPASDSKGNMHFVSLYAGSPKLLGVPQDGEETGKISEDRKGQNVTELLLQAGLAKTVPHRAEDDQAEVRDRETEGTISPLQQQQPRPQ